MMFNQRTQLCRVQLEWLTGGECLAGMHEVVVSEKTVAAVEAANKAGRSLWRVSSTVSFSLARICNFFKPAGSSWASPCCAALTINGSWMVLGHFIEKQM